MYKNTWGFSIVIALGLSLIFSIIWLFLMEYIIPFSRTTANIEQATIAQYKAFSWVEQSLRLISQQEPWYSSTWSVLSSWPVRRVDYSIAWDWDIIPQAGTWNWISSDWNRISQIEPIQLLIWDWRISNPFELQLRVPDFWGSGNLEPISAPLLLWQVSFENETLSASWGLIRTNDIATSDSGSTINLWTQSWFVISDNTTQNFWQFYNSNCWNSDECVLRVSVINPIIQWGVEIPFIEYQVRPRSWDNIPYQITNIQSTWLSFWFSRTYNVRVPQVTTSAAFDFTVFQ